MQSSPELSLCSILEEGLLEPNPKLELAITGVMTTYLDQK
jgi:hypothetical protein